MTWRAALIAIASLAGLGGALVAAALGVSGIDTITTVAGSSQGFSGDGGQATQAQLSAPLGVALDAQGRILIADFANHRVRRVGTNGVITTIAGNGTQGFSGDGGPAIAAQLNAPYDVAADAAGNVYINDQNNFRIRKVSPAGIITTLANVGLPQGIDVDPAGNVFVVDQPPSTILRITRVARSRRSPGTAPRGSRGTAGRPPRPSSSSPPR